MPLAHDSDLARSVLDKCRAAWPAVRCDEAALLERLARAIPEGEDEATAIAKLCVEDLFLASACLAGDEAALGALEDLLWAESTRAALALRQPRFVADEIHQALRHRLLYPDEGEPARLETYSGRGALASWLGVAATRVGLNLLRDQKREASFDEEDLASLAGAGDPELRILRERYKAAFESAVRDAFAAIDGARDRNLLRLYYFERLGLDELGAMYGVHGSTVSRWIAAVRARLFDETRRLLADRLAVSGSDLDSLVRLVRSDLDLSLSKLLNAPE